MNCCSICLDVLVVTDENTVRTPCRHEFHIACLQEYFNNSSRIAPPCPMCRAAITPRPSCIKVAATAAATSSATYASRLMAVPPPMPATNYPFVPPPPELYDHSRAVASYDVAHIPSAAARERYTWPPAEPQRPPTAAEIIQRGMALHARRVQTVRQSLRNRGIDASPQQAQDILRRLTDQRIAQQHQMEQHRRMQNLAFSSANTT